MIDMSQIGTRCVRIAGTLGARAQDEITLLRTARSLKVIHGHLTLAMRTRVRAEGRTQSTIRAEAALEAMEHDLRRVLIDYASMRRPQLHGHLVHALNRSQETLSLLQS
jgi:hypothetical protein